MKKNQQAKPKKVTLDGASSHRSFEGETRKSAPKPKASTRRVAPDKGELSPR
jgi:hypothetical protein